MLVVKTYTIEFGASEIGQVLDGLEIRAQAWEKTAIYLRTGKSPDNEMFVIEECKGPEEAEQIAGCYRSIIQSICSQMVERAR